MIETYGEKPETVYVDGGPWYHILDKMGINREIVSGKERNYLERWFQTLKNRTKNFDNYFPHNKDTQHFENWLNGYIYYYNRIRKHADSFEICLEEDLEEVSVTPITQLGPTSRTRTKP